MSTRRQIDANRLKRAKIQRPQHDTLIRSEWLLRRLFLQRLQAALQAAPPDPQPQPTTEQTAQLASFRTIPSPPVPESPAACQPLTST